jgi:hypothetical protein
MFPSIFSPSKDQMSLKIAYRIEDGKSISNLFEFYKFDDQNLFEDLPEFKAIYVAPQPISIDENKFWVYYIYKDESHSSWADDEIKYTGNIGRFQLAIKINDK